MKIKGALLSAIAFLTITSGARAAVTVVTFDDLTEDGAYVPNSYDGITWGTDVWYEDNLNGNPYNAESLPNVAYDGTDSLTQTPFYFSTPQVFDGAYFAGPAGYDNASFTLLLGGAIVATSGSLGLSPTPTFLSSGYTGLVDEVLVDNTRPGFWVLDNVTYGVSAAPEPSAWALMIAGIGSIGVALRRSKETPPTPATRSA